jgi:hypothetical protein
MPSTLHDFFIRYFTTDLYPKINGWLRVNLPNFESMIVLDPTMPIVSELEAYEPRYTRREPDAGAHIWRTETDDCGTYPQIIVEVGYTQSWPSLLRKASAWLCGSLGEVKCVVLVKVNPPTSDSEKDFGDETKWEAYLEIHVRSPDSK